MSKTKVNQIIDTICGNTKHETAEDFFNALDGNDVKLKDLTLLTGSGTAFKDKIILVKSNRINVFCIYPDSIPEKSTHRMLWTERETAEDIVVSDAKFRDIACTLFGIKLIDSPEPCPENKDLIEAKYMIRNKCLLGKRDENGNVVMYFLWPFDGFHSSRGGSFQIKDYYVFCKNPQIFWKKAQELYGVKIFATPANEYPCPELLPLARNDFWIKHLMLPLEMKSDGTLVIGYAKPFHEDGRYIIEDPFRDTLHQEIHEYTWAATRKSTSTLIYRVGLTDEQVRDKIATIISANK